MIGRWVLWMNYFIPWDLIYLQLRMKIVWNGSWWRMGILTRAHFIISYEIPCPLSFLGKEFGRLRLLSMFLSLFGPQFGIKFLREIICGVKALILLTGALCVVVIGRRWIICYSIVKKLIGCGAWFLDLSGFYGSCQDQLQILFLVGRIGLENTLLAFRI